MPISLPYTIANGDDVDANPIQSDYQTIAQYINQEVITRDGAVSMAAQLKLVGNPLAPLDAAPKQYLDTVMPIGIITMYGGVGAPPGGVWLKCDNSQYAVADYPALATVLNNAVGGLFRVPDMANHFPVGSGGTYPNNTSGGTADAVITAHTHPIDHTVPSTTTATEAGHTHVAPDHLHAPGTLVTATDGVHYHVPESPGAVGGFIVDGSGQPGVLVGPDLAIGGGAFAFANRTALPTIGAPDAAHGIHSHTVNGGQTGAADRVLTTTPGSAHGHTVPAVAVTATSGPTGESGAGKNIPPYTALTFIIRAA